MKMLITLVMFITFSSVSVAQQDSVDITPMLKKITAMASTGDAEAAYHLGMLHLNSIGLEKDVEEALRWIKISSNKNYPLGSYELGNFYAGAYGEVIESNPEEAFRNKKKAADAGYVLAQYDIGIMYLNFRNGIQGANYIEKAATQGHLPSYQTLSLLKFRGDMTPRDLVTSRTFIVLLKSALDAESGAQFVPIITQIEGELNPEQIAQSNQMVNDWKTTETDITIKANKGLNRTYEHVGMRTPSN
jgi:uncharacterized protein